MTGRAVRTLVLGGVRSGKSAYGESLLGSHRQVRYLATGSRTSTDAEWLARIAAHRERRDDRHITIETTDLAGELRATPDIPVIVDDLGSWLTARVDALGGWESGDVDLGAEIADLCDALRGMNADTVVISSEVGLSLVLSTPAGRLFQDLLGTLNAAVAQACDRVSLVIAGRVLDLPRGEFDAAPVPPTAAEPAPNEQAPNDRTSNDQAGEAPANAPGTAAAATPVPGTAGAPAARTRVAATPVSYTHQTLPTNREV